MSVPALRFKEFSGFWEEKKLGEIIQIVSGYPFSSELFAKEGKKLVIPKNFTQTGYGNFSNEYLKFTSEECDKKYISNSGDLLLLLTDLNQNCELLGKPLLLKIDDGEVLLNQRIIRIENDVTLNKVFLMNFFLTENYHKEIKKTASGTTVKHSSNKIITNLPLSFPSLPEQTKIANFLTSVDEKITLITQKSDLLSQYKKGVMQQIYNQELRFKDDDGQEFTEWKEKALGEVLDYEQPTKYLVSSTKYSNDFKTPVLTAGKTFILGYTDETVGLCEQGLPVIIFDDFTTAFKFVPFSFKAKSSAMKILRKKDGVNINYIYSAMQQIDFQSGDEHKRYWISEYSQINIPYPAIKEQAKIANFLTAINEKITNNHAQLNAVKQYKQGLLQQIFT